MPKSKVPPNLNGQIRDLVARALTFPGKSVQRRRILNQVVRLVSRSGKLWYESNPDYEDALQQTWCYCLQNLEKYDPSRSSFITWIDNTLKWRLKDIYRAKARGSYSGLPTDVADRLPAPNEIPPILEETKAWIENDPTGDLQRTHVHERPDITCQVLLLRRLPPEVPWKDIASEFGIPLSTASNFYKRECLPRLRHFAVDKGYLDKT